ncbi:Rrf2 family transcriptional regulator [Polynucleobacter sp. 86C-FISCH]|uniref:RrF2 family transcriptional regulator n=1 Tax=Polynucleobacter sp. 86C-FISCH TaxID=2689101 RepID=UPI001C0D5F23|nr:Rrf2 family transcriptional regulator [Polynucleobacter sp. 86C-FISCH]MBU3594792.1 Rrf2 family transcriptional regulator [Polynucleobacter sp. 86C-FISCH]
MRISTKSKIALNALIDIAAHTAMGYAISLPTVSKRSGISHSYLELIFSDLKVAGFIYGYRGAGGGYSLAKNAGDISVKDVVDATGDPQPPVSGPGTQIWLNLEWLIQGRMSQITLEHILANTAVEIEPSMVRLRYRLEKMQPNKTKALSRNGGEPIAVEASKNIGPNSVFDFGDYLSRKNS